MSVQNKPPEIFPEVLKALLIFGIPAIVFIGFQFELVRLQDDLQFWTVLFAWVVVTILLNRLVWKKGLKKYESVG
jgi:ABC-type uncharacterized transport system permease subunit